MRIVDVGARAPTDPFYRLDGIEVLGFEPDRAEAQRVSAAGLATVLPFALGDSSRFQPFYVTADPQCSSFYRPNDAVIEAFEGLEGAQLRSISAVEVRTLDEAIEWDAINLLKIDVQGAALNVLRGAERTLRACDAVLVEAEFLPIYVGEPLFPAVDAFLLKAGFNFVHFASIHSRRQRSDGREIPLWCDALYLRRIEACVWTHLYPSHPLEIGQTEIASPARIAAE